MPTTALIAGATGQTGRQLLSFLLSSPAFSSVKDVGRRSAAEAGVVQVPADAASKLATVAVDLGKPEEAETKKDQLTGADVVYVTLGTTRKNAGSAEAFEAIDRGYPVRIATLARTPGSSQKVVYLSSMGASASSPLLYSKSKGLTEQELAALGYDETIVFRPGLLAGTSRSESRLGEELYGAEIPVQKLGPAMAKAGLLGYKGLEEHKVGKKTDLGKGHSAWVVDNAAALKLAAIEM